VRLLLLILPLLLPTIALAAPRVAVLDFESSTADPALAPLGKGLQSMLTTDLAQLSALTLVERARLQEVQAEVRLGKEGWADPATAAKIGKLAGASHLLAGTFTVLDGRMRIDARLVLVEEGTVALTATVDGERDAFFELEKDLVRRLVEALSVQAQPKERAGLSRVHTADWEAFLDFSQGIDAFDGARYDAALERLRAATERDADFALARYTLSRYEELITSLRARSDQIETARQELERLEKQKAASGLAGMVGKLVQIAGRTGQAAQRERITALYLLTVGYANLGSRGQKLWELRQREDQWAMGRAAEGFARAYHAEARGLWPQVPPLVTAEFAPSLPEPDSFEKDFADAVSDLWGRPNDLPENRKNALLSDLRYPAEFARLLLLSGAEALALREDLVAMAGRLHPEPYWQEEADEALTKEYRELLRLDDSSRILERRARAETNEWAIRGFTQGLEENRDTAAILQRAAAQPWMREFLLLAKEGGWSLDAARNFLRERTALDEKAKGYLARFRQLDDGEDVRIGTTPLWVLQGAFWLLSGPRTDPRVARSLRYWKPQADDELDAIVLMDGVPRARRRVELTIDWKAAPDFWPHRGDAAKVGTAGIPSVGLLWNVTDVRVPKEDQVDGPDVLKRPMRGALIELGPTGGRSGTFVEGHRGSYDRTERLDVQATAAPLRAGGEIRLALDTCGKATRFTAGGKELSTTLAAPAAGYAGLWFHGAGYVEVRDLSVVACPGGG
jgi:TolB-like protein